MAIDAILKHSVDGAASAGNIGTQVRQVAAHSDRIARVLARQYFELSHGEHLIDACLSLTAGLVNHAGRSVSATSDLKGALRAASLTSLQTAPADGASDLGSEAQRVLSVIRGSAETLARRRGQPAEANAALAISQWTEASNTKEQGDKSLFDGKVS